MRSMGRIAAALAALMVITILLPTAGAQAAPACPPGDADYPPFYQDSSLFDAPIAGAAKLVPSSRRLTGIVVPHHLTAAHLVALGFQAASGQRYRRIVILAPDHFRGSSKPFATTTRGFSTVYGRVAPDMDAARALLDMPDIVEDSCLFDKDHGVRAMLPFIRHHFPEAAVVPIAVSLRSGRDDWELMAAKLQSIVDAETLVVESTDFSHYLPHHEARKRDQETLNVIASGSLDQLALLTQPAHLDSLGALYIQTRLQARAWGALPTVIANENQQQYDTRTIAETTSYIVVLFGPDDGTRVDPLPEDVETVFFAGDVNFGRAMKHALIGDGAEERVLDAIRARTRAAPLVVNLEGVILPNVPEAIDDMTLAMPRDLTLDWLRKMNVAAVGLANNHAMDLGASGYAETLDALDEAGIPRFGQGEVVALGSLDIVGLTDIDTNGSPQIDLLTEELLDRLVRPDGRRPVVAFVHWGREYVTEPSERERMLAEAMRLRSVTAIVGAHPHVASDDLEALAGGETLLAYSLGNFLFDQTAARSSGALLELKVFRQGTIAARLVPLPNLFDLATK